MDFTRRISALVEIAEDAGRRIQVALDAVAGS